MKSVYRLMALFAVAFVGSKILGEAYRRTESGVLDPATSTGDKMIIIAAFLGVFVLGLYVLARMHRWYSEAE